jgi:hypothetical protein
MGVNINGSAPGTGTAGRQLYPYVTSDMNSYEPFGSMTYEGLQMTMRKRIGSSIIGASYAFSKGIDDANGDNGDATLWRAYPVSYSLDKQLSGINRAQTLSIYWVYNLPFGKGHTMFTSGPAAYIIGGWQISGILTRFSGLPFTVGTTSAINAGGQGTSASQINTNVAILGGHDANDPYYDGTAFANPPGGVLGTTGRDLLIGPGYFQLNASVRRTFAFKSEKIRFELVGEAYNLTNTVVFANPGGSCCWTTNATTGATVYNGFGIISGTQSTPRYIEVGGYLRF